MPEHGPKRKPPLTLADVVPFGCDSITIGLASDAAVQVLAQPVDATSGLVDDTLSDWRLIALSRRYTGATDIHVVGDSARRGRPLVSSRITAFDEVSRLVRTHSGSIYSLARVVGGGEPPQTHLLALMAALRTWGVVGLHTM